MPGIIWRLRYGGIIFAAEKIGMASSRGYESWSVGAGRIDHHSTGWENQGDACGRCGSGNG